MAAQNQPGFQSRVDAVFGALSTAQPEAAWSLSGQQVYRTGKETEYSSDEEEEAKAGDAERQELLSSGAFVDLEDHVVNEEGLLEKPSNAFCKALDNEEEYDANDAVAFGVVERTRDPKPPRDTEVLDGNIFERMSRDNKDGVMEATPLLGGLNQERVSEAATVMEVDPPTTNVEAARSAQSGVPQTQAHTASGTGRTNDGNVHEESQGAPKRVRSAQGAEPWVPPYRRPNNSESSQRRETLPSKAKPPLGPSAGRRARGRGSYVPDHVRNPQSYTAYVLDEPITVGSGDAGEASADNGRSMLAQAARAAQTAAGAARPADESQPEPEVELPAFGAGIAFKPPVKAGRPKEAPQSETADRANRRHVSTTLADEDLGGEQDADDEAASDAAMNDASFAPRKQRNRSLRTRSAT